MGVRSIDKETIPCPPSGELDPDSGDHDIVSRRIPLESGLAPRSLRTMEQELRDRLEGIHCPDHGKPAQAELSIADDGSVQVNPVVCCHRLEHLVFARLRETVTLAPPSDASVAIPRIPR
jgi:hypothetical protein